MFGFYTYILYFLKNWSEQPDLNWHHLLGRQIYYHYTIPTQRRVCVTIASGQNSQPRFSKPVPYLSVNSAKRRGYSESNWNQRLRRPLVYPLAYNPIGNGRNSKSWTCIPALSALWSTVDLCSYEVGIIGCAPTTSCSQGKRSTKLS